MVLVCAAACVAAESFLCMDVHAQESDFEAMLKDNILTLSPGPSGNAIPVMNGLYFIYMPGGQPLEFDESVFKDRKHFDPELRPGSLQVLKAPDAI